jgi:hypothetical protein
VRGMAQPRQRQRDVPLLEARRPTRRLHRAVAIKPSNSNPRQTLATKTSKVASESEHLSLPTWRVFEAC